MRGARCENGRLPASPVIRLICWDAQLARTHAAGLQAAGFSVDSSPFTPSRIIGAIKGNPPAAIVIDLDRLPSHGRAVASVLGSSASTRSIPLAFAGGAEEKAAVAREQFPSAILTPWNKAAAALRKALKNPPAAAPLKTPHPMQRYAAAPLARKLGLPDSAPCALIHAPEGFEETLDGLPVEFEFQSRIAPDTKLAIWFVRTAGEMALAIERAALRLPQGASAWMVFPKQSGRIACDFTANHVRRTALDSGLVDYKICAVDRDWTGMKFARRRK